MARIRSIHPGFFTDEDIVSVSPLARLLFLGLLAEADDQGVHEWKPRVLKMRLLPVDDADVEALLHELLEADRIVRFEAEGRAYGAIRNFRRWQRPRKPNAVHPLPTRLMAYVGLAAAEEPSAADPRTCQAEQDSGDEPSCASGDALKAAPAGGNAEPVPRKSGIAAQREDGRGRREEEEESPHPPDDAAPGGEGRLNEGGGPSAPPSVRRGRWRGTRASGTNPRALAAAEAAAARRSPPEPDHPLWPTFRAQGVDPTTFGRWIPQLKFRVEEGVTQVLAPTRFHADHVQGEYRHILEAATGTPVRFNAILTARKS